MEQGVVDSHALVSRQATTGSVVPLILLLRKRHFHYPLVQVSQLKDARLTILAMMDFEFVIAFGSPLLLSNPRSCSGPARSEHQSL